MNRLRDGMLETAPAWLGAVRFALMVLWSAAILLVLASTINDSPIRTSLHMRLNVLAVAPEGWAFFTRNPREPVILVHKRGTAGWQRLDTANFTASNLFGLRRGSRLVMSELAQLLRGVPQDRWVLCRAPVSTCLTAWEIPRTVVRKKTSVAPELCGETLLQIQEPVPWAWRGSASRLYMPSKLLQLQVTCP